MEISFWFYIICSLVIFGIIIISIFRNISIYEYQNKYITDGTEQLKYIPKNIFQLIADKNKINPEFQYNINYIKKMNPDWSYTLYDDYDINVYILENYGPEFLECYNKINPKYGAARADFFRYLLMYREGGVYLDIKSATKYPLQKIILPDDEYILSNWDIPLQFFNVGYNKGEFQQWHIICRPRHPFLYAVIQEVIKNIYNYDSSIGVGKSAVLKVTGPIAYTKAILPILNNYNHRIIDINDYAGLVYNNLQTLHVNLFSKTHYSKINEPVIIK